MKSKNTILSKQFQNPIDKSQREVKAIPLAHIKHDRSLFWLADIHAVALFVYCYE